MSAESLQEFQRELNISEEFPPERKRMATVQLRTEEIQREREREPAEEKGRGRSDKRGRTEGEEYHAVKALRKKYL